MVVALTGCKTVDVEPAPAAVAAPLSTNAIAQPETVLEEPSEIAGFDRSGAIACLPLPEGRKCIQRQDKLAAACATSGGETLVCEDCAILCSKPLTVQ